MTLLHTQHFMKDTTVTVTAWVIIDKLHLFTDIKLEAKESVQQDAYYTPHQL